MTKNELLQNLIKKAHDLPLRDKLALNAFLQEAETVIKGFYGNTANYLAELKMIRFTPWSFQSSENEFRTSWNSGKNALINLFESMINDPTVIVPPAEPIKVEIPHPTEKPEVVITRKKLKPQETSKRKVHILGKIKTLLKKRKRSEPKEEVNSEPDPIIIEEKSGSTEKQAESPLSASEAPLAETLAPPKREPKIVQRIFVIGGLDKSINKTIADTLEQCGCETILTREKPHLQKTMMQKLTEFNDVSCAAVVLTPDDFAYKKSEKPKDAKLRPFQDVVFEMGVFIGKLGRNRVIVFHPEKSNFELPSTYFDALYIPLDKEERWKTEMIEKLKSFGFQVNTSSIKKSF